MSTLDAVAEILREVAPRALCAKEIVTLAAGRLPTASRTPETVVSRDLALEVKKNGASSKFLRVDRGEFVLKEALPIALYNEIDPYAAAWTKALATAGEIAPGVVDERSIRDLKPADVASYRQFHAFCGISVWSRALRDAGIPDDFNVWSGSAPCQPISQAGRRRGVEDDRHLWPEWFRLISACRPALIVGEQVASKDALSWVDVVRSDLESANYAFGILDTPAASVGAPHARQRLYWVAYARSRGREILSAPWLHDRGKRGDDVARCSTFDDGAAASTVQDGSRARTLVRRAVAFAGRGNVDGGGRNIASSGELGDTRFDGDRQHGGELLGDEAQHDERSPQGDHASVTTSAAHRPATYRPGDRIRITDDPTWGGSVRGFWANDIEWIYCRPTPGYENGCFRPIESGTQPLAFGASEELGRTRTARLRCYGNAIVLPQATAFIEAVIDALADAAHAQRSVATSIPIVEVPAPVSPEWTGPRPGETAPSGLLYGRVPGERWPYGPPSAHAPACNLFPHRGSPGGLYCDCAASAADDVAYGVGA